LLADDDADDREFARAAWSQSGSQHELVFVEDGEELLRYLRQEGPYAGRPLPALVLLDLNMPRLDGREVLRELRDDPELRRVPVVVLTTSSDPEDVALAYDLGARSY